MCHAPLPPPMLDKISISRVGSRIGNYSTCSTRNPSTAIVGHRLSFVNALSIVALSMKEIYSRCRPIFVGCKFVTNEATTFTTVVQSRVVGWECRSRGLLLPNWCRYIFFLVVVGVLVFVVECNWQVVDPLGVGCPVLTADLRVSLSVSVVCSWLSGVGCRVLVVDCRCQLSLTVSFVGAQLCSNISTLPYYSLFCTYNLTLIILTNIFTFIIYLGYI
jgi:hypothetical protein